MPHELNSDGVVHGVKLENALVSFGFDEARGALISIFDKRTGTEMVADAGSANLWRLMVPTDRWRGAHVDAAQSIVTEASVCGSDTEGFVGTLGYAHPISGGSLRIAVSLRLGADDDFLELVVEVKNSGTDTVTDVLFPWVAGLGAIEKADTDRIILPSTWARVIYAPLASLPSSHFGWNRSRLKSTHRYLERLVTGWMDYCGNHTGIGLDARDTSFEPQDAYIEKMVSRCGDAKLESLSMAWVRYPHIGPGESWTSQPVRLRVHEGDWHALAKDHREWAASWVRRPDTPKEYRSSIGWSFIFMKHEDGTVVHTYDELPLLADKMKRCGVTNLLIFGWFDEGHDTLFPQYRPVDEWGGADALRVALAACHALGVRTILYINPTIWETRTPEYRQSGRAWAAHSRLGCEYHESYAWANFDASTESRMKSFVRICPDNPSTNYTLDIVKRIISDYGAESIHLDQAARAFACYNAGHAHARPQAASRDGYARLLSEIYRSVRAAGPGIVSLEGMSEFHSQWGDSSWNWSQLESAEVLRYSMPWMPYSHELDAGEVSDANRAFVLGLMFDLRIDGGEGLLSDYPAFADHVRRLSELKRNTAPYLAEAMFEDAAGVTSLDGPSSRDTSDVMVRSYANRPVGKAGLAIANLSGEPRSCRVTVDWGELGLDAHSRLSGHVVGTAREGAAMSPRDGAVELELAGWEVVVLCVVGG